MPFEIIIPVALAFFILGIVKGLKAKRKVPDHELVDAALTDQNN